MARRDAAGARVGGRIIRQNGFPAGNHISIKVVEVAELEVSDLTIRVQRLFVEFPIEGRIPDDALVGKNAEYRPIDYDPRKPVLASGHFQRSA